MESMRTILLLLLTSCSSTFADDPGPSVDARATDATPHVSGSRIKRVVWKTSDGASIETGSHDALRGEDCAFILAADGQTRCLPTATLYGSTRGPFADATCTIPVGAWYTCSGTVPSLMRIALADVCPSAPRTRVHQRGAPVTSIYYKSGSSCVLNAPDPGVAYYVPGAEVAAGEFALGTRTVE